MGNDFLIVMASYFLGALPSGYVFTRLFSNLNILKVGSGNVGGMNTIRYVGIAPGLLTIVADIGKGALAVYIASVYSTTSLLPLIAIFFVVLGHNFSIFIGFKGGKGLGATLGALLVLSPLTIVYVLICIAFMSLLLRDTNTGTATGILSLPVILRFQYAGWVWSLIGLAISLVIVIKHAPDFGAYAKGRRQIV